MKSESFEKMTMDEPELIYGTAKTIDQKDLKLLMLLENNARTPISKLSKNVGLSRDAVKYRINKLLENKILLKFTTTINPPNLGFSNISTVLISLWNLNPQKEDNFINHIKNNPNITYFARVGGRWDYTIEITARNPGHYDEILTNIRRKFSEIIKEYENIPLLKEYKMNKFPFSSNLKQL